ncbi:ABC transporter ATP-binding protein [Mediterraneibacter gnavus]|uniref:ABC transporter ATP-binding protein n=1 Tax=Mediterraneibacter gnavus TaxID=33038 RepID=UPI00321BD0B6
MKRYLKQSKFLLFLATLFTAISSLSYVFIAILLQKVMDIVDTGNMNSFIRILIFSLNYFALMGVFMYLQSLFSKKLVCKIMKNIRSKTFAGIESHTLEDYLKNHTADYLSAITNDVKMIEDNYLLPLLQVIQNTIIFLASMAIMIYFDIIVTICVIVAIALMFVVPSLFGKMLAKQQDAYSDMLSRFTNHVKDLLAGFEVIKSYRMKKYVLERFESSNENTIEAKYLADKTIAANEAVSMVLALLVQVVVVFLSAYFIIVGRITAGTLLGMVQVSSNLANPLLIIFSNIPKIKSVDPIIKKLNAFADYQRQDTMIKTIPTFNQKINIKNLHFSYDKVNEVIHGIDISIEKGRKYAFVGKSGCGKSTLIKLIAGYYSNFEGDIRYDSESISALNMDKITALSSVIHQNVFMFDESIFDNICLHESFTEEELSDALFASGLLEFIEQIPNGKDYIVGENGSNLSGGQKQRIAVARALIRKKPLLILDEGTSAIDMQTAYDIESRLLKIPDLTLITITHTMNKDLLEQYDEIVFITDGEIIEHGTFETLVNRHAEFFDFYQLKK